jgi:hypothetical protein
MMLLEHLLNGLASVFENGEGSAQNWGDEVTRLPPAMAACVDDGSETLLATPAVPPPAPSGAQAMVHYFPQCATSAR